MNENSDIPVDASRIVCIICPRSCLLEVFKDELGYVEVHNAECPRGEKYGLSEYSHPVRMLMTTVRLDGGSYPVIPVRSRVAIPMENIFDAVIEISAVSCRAPVKMGDVILKNIAGTGVDAIASRDS